MRFVLCVFKYFDEAFCTLVMLERPAQSLAYFLLWVTAKGERKRTKKINDFELERKWANASETWDVEFRCMVTDGKPCRNQKMVFIFLWFCTGNIRCKWNPYYRMDGLANKDKHPLEVCFSRLPLFVKMSIADCFTCLCSAHSFLPELESTEKQTPNNHLSKCREGLEKSHHCLHLTNITKGTWRRNRVEKKKKKHPEHAREWRGI